MTCYKIGGKGPQFKEESSSWIAPSADVIGDVEVGREVGVWFGAVIRGDNTRIEIGDGTNVQEGAMLHSDEGIPLSIGENVTVGHHAILHGCKIGDRVLVGMGATVMNNAVIGAESIIGSGALITEGKEFPPRSLIVGAPAKAVRTLDESVVETLLESAELYKRKCKQFAQELEVVD